jgi:hypothetical protein
MPLIAGVLLVPAVTFTLVLKPTQVPEHIHLPALLVGWP